VSKAIQLVRHLAGVQRHTWHTARGDQKGVGGASPPPELKKKADCHLGPSLRDLARFADARLFLRDKPRLIPP